jgi:hypothetical protein
MDNLYQQINLYCMKGWSNFYKNLWLIIILIPYFVFRGTIKLEILKVKYQGSEFNED